MFPMEAFAFAGLVRVSSAWRLHWLVSKKIMEDPGFLSGLIGWVIGFAMGLLVEQIKIVLSFPQQLEKLQNLEIYASFCGENSTCSPKLEKLLEEVSPMVKSGCAVSETRFDILSRYVMGKRITNLISKIETNEPLLFYHIGAVACGKKQTEVEGKMVTLVAPSSLAQTSPTPALAEDAPASAPVMSQVATEATSAVSEVASEATPAVSELASETTPAVSEVVAQHSVVTMGMPTTPSAEEEVPLDDGGSGFFSRFKGILEYMNVDVSGRKQLASLKDLTMQIRPTITLLKELQVDSTFDGNGGSAVQAWSKRLEQSLHSADDMITKYEGHFVYDGKTKKTISGLIAEINALLKWGQVIIGFECFKN